MKVVVQRVKEASVSVREKVVGQISKGMLVFVAVGKEDTQEDVRYLVDKITQLRMFEDEQGKMNCSILDVGGELLIVSQFTLLGDCRKGRRPSFDRAAEPQQAERLYQAFVDRLREGPLKVETGEFKAMMDVHLVNDGPVTFILDSKSN